MFLKTQNHNYLLTKRYRKSDSKIKLSKKNKLCLMPKSLPFSTLCIIESGIRSGNVEEEDFAR